MEMTGEIRERKDTDSNSLRYFRTQPPLSISDSNSVSEISNHRMHFDGLSVQVIIIEG